MQDDKQTLQRILELTEDNNKMLRKLRSSARWAAIWRVVYWVVIIVSSVSLYYFVQPMLQSALKMYQQAFSNIDQLGKGVQGLPNIDAKQIQSILNSLPK